MSEHEHEHDHGHGHEDGCACEECRTRGHDRHEQALDASDAGEAFGVIHIESRPHDEARVVSGRLSLRGDEALIKAGLQSQLGNMARAVAALGGIVGHIKASCETTVVDMYSVTDAEAASKRSPEAVVRIKLAAIVFAVDPEDAEQLAAHALEAVRDGI